MGVYTKDDGVVTFNIGNTMQYAYVIEESPLVVERAEGKYKILSDSGFKMTLADLNEKTKGTVKLQQQQLKANCYCRLKSKMQRSRKMDLKL
ncbi:MAG: hypothetical protein ACI4PK_01460 [Oscillospiraceae bacterium]